MSTPRPACDSPHSVKNGRIHNGKQNFKCRECGRQFVQDPHNKVIDQATTTLIDKLLLEKIPLAGIARAAGVSELWLQSYVNAKYEAVPRQIEVSAKKRALDDSMRRAGVICGEQGQQAMATSNGNKQWIWLALDVNTREIVGVYVGDCSREGAQGLWDSVPSPTLV